VGRRVRLPWGSAGPGEEESRLLEFTGVVVTSAGRARLDRCTFAARAGEVLAVVGGTGSGKSTLLAVAAGALAVDRGRVLWSGREVSRQPTRLRAISAWVTRPLPGPCDLSVAAWLSTWAALDGVPRAEVAARVEAAQDRLHGPGSQRLVQQLSAGERARLALARAWIARPRLLLLDSPTADLDGAGLRATAALIGALAAEGVTVLLADSGPTFVAQVADRALLLEAGAVRGEVSRGAPDFAPALAAAAGWQA
jgi:ABC-type multidrug transport system ATPase subunit